MERIFEGQNAVHFLVTLLNRKLCNATLVFLAHVENIPQGPSLTRENSLDSMSGLLLVPSPAGQFFGANF